MRHNPHALENVHARTMATNLNKGPLSIALGDGWKTRARNVPIWLRPLGLVTRKGLTQSLGVDQSGEYWAFGTGTPEPLPRQKVQGALAQLATGMNQKPSQ